MAISQKTIACMSHTWLLVSALISSAGSVVLPSGESLEQAVHQTANNTLQKIDPQLQFQMEVHGFLLWASVGLLTPVGVVLMRLSHRVDCRKRLKILFYLHAVLEIISVLLATVGAIMALKNFENKFNNTHQKIGLAIYALIWLQPFIGLCRPHRGIKGRSSWYFLHWLLGTGVSLLGFLNIYIGLYAYHNRTSNNVTVWVILLTAEVSFLSFLYLLQDKWDYLQKQRSFLGAEEPIRPTHQVSSLANKMGGT
ncbi:Cytochrome b561 domain-containing protein [Nymphaea thermarum]|nr:Cytochrome b561 domain-containing protein [Nymphaea thermarum]